MATFYQGYRNILKGRNGNVTHIWKGTVNVYSNWDLMNPDHPLDGAPNTNTVLGDDSRLSRPRLLEYIFAGKHHIAPVNNVGGGERLDGARYRPLEYKGLEGTKVFKSAYGHTQLYFSDYRYSNYIFDGVTSADLMSDVGHTVRYDTDWGGAFNPWVFKGVGDGILEDAGSVLPQGYDNEYGKNKVLEWRGVPSAQAL